MSRLLLSALVLFPFAVMSADDPAVAAGAKLYAQYCISCHGRQGQGDGPVATSLTVEPADLTAISAHNGGEYPEKRIREKIDGRVAISAHGPREMPVWGYELEARTPLEVSGRRAAQTATDQLVEYLRSIQR